MRFFFQAKRYRLTCPEQAWTGSAPLRSLRFVFFDPVDLRQVGLVYRASTPRHEGRRLWRRLLIAQPLIGLKELAPGQAQELQSELLAEGIPL